MTFSVFFTKMTLHRNFVTYNLNIGKMMSDVLSHLSMNFKQLKITKPLPFLLNFWRNILFSVLVHITQIFDIVFFICFFFLKKKKSLI